MAVPIVYENRLEPIIVRIVPMNNSTRCGGSVSRTFDRIKLIGGGGREKREMGIRSIDSGNNCMVRSSIEQIKLIVDKQQSGKWREQTAAR